MSTDIGNRIRSERRAARLTQGELAARTGISQNQLSRYERGLVEIPAVRLGTIALALRVSIAILDTRLATSSDPQHATEVHESAPYGVSVPPPLQPLIQHWDALPPPDQHTVIQVADLVLAKNGLGGGCCSDGACSPDLDQRGA